MKETSMQAVTDARVLMSTFSPVHHYAGSPIKPDLCLSLCCAMRSAPCNLNRSCIGCRYSLWQLGSVVYNMPDRLAYNALDVCAVVQVLGYTSGRLIICTGF